MSFTLYDALSECNLAAVNCSSEMDLHAQVCRSLANVPQLKMAWFGNADLSDGQVMPVAAHGHGTDLLSGSLISLRESGPIVAAIEQLQPYFGNNCQLHPEQTDWHHRVGRLGCDAFAVLPITTHQKVVGVLCLCAESEAFFSDNNRQLLACIATFVSFALDSFATESDRRRVQEQHKAALAQSEHYRSQAQHSHQTLSSVLNRVNDGIVALNKDWIYTFLNERAAKMLQRDTPEDLLGKNIWTEYPEGVGQPFQLAYEKAMQTQQIVVFEEHYEPWDLWFENRVFPSSDGITIYFSDITERKKSELALREAASAFSSIRDAVITTDTELTILTINHAFERVCGYEESEALGKTASFLQDFDSAESFESAAEHLQEQGFWQGKIFGRRKCGAIFPGWLSANLIDAQPGLPKRFIFVLSDITE